MVFGVWIEKCEVDPGDRAQEQGVLVKVSKMVEKCEIVILGVVKNRGIWGGPKMADRDNAPFFLHGKRQESLSFCGKWGFNQSLIRRQPPPKYPNFGVSGGPPQFSGFCPNFRTLMKIANFCPTLKFSKFTYGEIVLSF